MLTTNELCSHNKVLDAAMASNHFGALTHTKCSLSDELGPCPGDAESLTSESGMTETNQSVMPVP